MAFGPKPKPLKELFMLHFDIKNDDECWEWKSSLIGSGYGQFQCRINGIVHRYAHRVSWVLYKGDIPDGMKILHKCDNRKCVNPNHLFIGTQKDNVADMDQKGRRVVVAHFGENHKRAILNIDAILDIKNSNLKNTELAAKYGVRPSAISKVRCGRTWKNQSHSSTTQQ